MFSLKKKVTLFLSANSFIYSIDYEHHPTRIAKAKQKIDRGQFSPLRPSWILGISLSATQREACGAFEDQLNWLTVDHREKVRSLRRVGEFERDCRGLVKRSEKLLEDLDEHLWQLSKALMDILRPYYDGLDDITVVRGAMVQFFPDKPVSFAAFSLLREVFLDAENSVKEVTTESSPDANEGLPDVLCAFGPGKRDSVYPIYWEEIECHVSSVTHSDGACQNTFCRDCFQEWIRTNPKRVAACPMCRGKLKDVRLWMYLEGQKVSRSKRPSVRMSSKTPQVMDVSNRDATKAS